MLKAILYTVVFILIQLLVGGTFQGVWALATDRPLTEMPATMYIVMMVAVNVASIAVFIWCKWAVVSRSYVRSRPWGVLFWCSMAACGAIIPSTWLQELMPELPNLAEQQFDMILKDRWGYLAVGLLAPLGEELVFRGAVLRILLQRNTTSPESPDNRDVQHSMSNVRRSPFSVQRSIALSALLFALVHANPAQMPHAFLIGLLLGWMYYRTDSIVPGVAYHWVNNTIAYVMYNFYPDPSLKLADVFGGSQQNVLLAVTFSMLIFLPALYQLNQRLRKVQPC